MKTQQNMAVENALSKGLFYFSPVLFYFYLTNFLFMLFCFIDSRPLTRGRDFIYGT